MSLAGWHRNQGGPGTSNVLLVNVDTKTRVSITKLMPSATRRWNAVVVVPGPVGVHWCLKKKNTPGCRSPDSQRGIKQNVL